MKKTFDALVVGGGPIGSNVASRISRSGYNVAVIEQKSSIGVPLKCAGLVTNRVFSLADIPYGRLIQNEITGAYIHSPKGEIYKMGGDRKRAYVIDREEFDKDIAEKAERNGVTYLLENRAFSFKRNDSKIKIYLKNTKNSEEEFFESDILIGADGANSAIRRHFSLPEPNEFLMCIGAEVDNVDIEPDFVHLFFGKEIAPGFFAWIIPLNKEGDSARMGLCVSQPPPKSMRSYFLSLFNYPSTRPYLENAVITETIGGVIPLGYLDRTVDNNIMIVGDAASQVKPLSGGGLYTGLLSSKYCSQVATSALEENNFTKKFLEKYHRLWSGDLKREILIGMKIRKKFLLLDDKEIEKYLFYLRDKTILSTIEKYGDIDYPSRLIFPFIRIFPRFMKAIPSLMDLFF